MTTGTIAATLPAPTTVRTLADVRNMLTAMADAPPDTALMLSAINTIARTLGCAPDDISADPATLRVALGKISPAMAGLTKGSWASTKSRVLKALQVAKINVAPGRRVAPLSDGWATLYKSLPDNTWKAALGRLMSYCSERVYPPEAVCDAVVERFERELKETSLRGRPNDIIRGAIRG